MSTHGLLLLLIILQVNILCDPKRILKVKGVKYMNPLVDRRLSDEILRSFMNKVKLMNRKLGVFLFP